MLRRRSGSKSPTTSKPAQRPLRNGRRIRCCLTGGGGGGGGRPAGVRQVIAFLAHLWEMKVLDPPPGQARSRTTRARFRTLPWPRAAFLHCRRTCSVPAGHLTALRMRICVCGRMSISCARVFWPVSSHPVPHPCARLLSSPCPPRCIKVARILYARPGGGKVWGAILMKVLDPPPPPPSPFPSLARSLPPSHGGQVRGPFLIVAPLSTVSNWVAELGRCVCVCARARVRACVRA